MFSNLLCTLYGILNFNLLRIVNERLSSMTFRSIFLLMLSRRNVQHGGSTDVSAGLIDNVLICF